MKLNKIAFIATLVGSVAIASTAHATGYWNTGCEEGSGGCASLTIQNVFRGNNAAINGGFATDAAAIYEYVPNQNYFVSIFSATFGYAIDGVITDTNGLPWYAECKSLPLTTCNIGYLTSSSPYTWTAHVLATSGSIIGNMAVGSACVNSGSVSGCNDANIFVQEGNNVYEWNGSAFTQILTAYIFGNLTQIAAMPFSGDCGNVAELHLYDASVPQLYQLNSHWFALGSCRPHSALADISPPTGGIGIMSTQFIGNGSGVWKWASNNTWSQIGNASCDGVGQLFFGANPGGSLAQTNPIWCATNTSHPYLEYLYGY